MTAKFEETVAGRRHEPGDQCLSLRRRASSPKANGWQIAQAIASIIIAGIAAYGFFADLTFRGETRRSDLTQPDRGVIEDTQ